MLFIYRPRKDERLSWPSWLTCTRRFTHISGHPSAAGRAQERESLPVRDRRSTTVPRHQPEGRGEGKPPNPNRNIGNGHHRQPALCQLYRHTFVSLQAIRTPTIRYRPTPVLNGAGSQQARQINLIWRNECQRVSDRANGAVKTAITIIIIHRRRARTLATVPAVLFPLLSVLVLVVTSAIASYCLEAACGVQP